ARLGRRGEPRARRLPRAGRRGRDGPRDRVDVSAEPAQLRGLGRPIKGPSALGGDPRRFFHLTWTLAVTEFKLRFFGSVLGYLWQLMRPLLFFGVLLLVFTQFVKLGNNVFQYPVVLLMSIVIYTFFAEATGGAVGS